MQLNLRWYFLALFFLALFFVSPGLLVVLIHMFCGLFAIVGLSCFWAKVSIRRTWCLIALYASSLLLASTITLYLFSWIGFVTIGGYLGDVSAGRGGVDASVYFDENETPTIKFGKFSGFAPIEFIRVYFIRSYDFESMRDKEIVGLEMSIPYWLSFAGSSFSVVVSILLYFRAKEASVR